MVAAIFRRAAIIKQAPFTLSYTDMKPFRTLQKFRSTSNYSMLSDV